MKQYNRSGFTLIELLVVIAIIGVLSTLAIIALGSARQKSRDAKRVADMAQVGKALELYYNDNGGYPTIITPGQALSSGSTTYMAVIPTNPLPRAENGCADSDYTYGYITTSYSFGGCLASGSGSLGAGPVWTTPEGSSSNRDGLVAFWKFGEGTGSTTADSSGNGNTGSLISSPVWTTSSGCKYGNCLVFSATNDYVSVTNSSSVNVSGTGISFGGWIDYTSIGANVVALDKSNSYRLWAKSSGLISCVVGTGSGWAALSADATAPSSGWHHVFCTFDGSTTKTYVDGDLKATAATVITMNGNATNPRIGIRSDALSGEMNTGLDNIRIYNRALTPGQVKGLYLNDGDN